MSKYTIVVGDYLQTQPLKDGSIAIEGAEITFPEVKPIHTAFAHMVRELAYDVSEMAIATYLQAREARKPIALMPLVMSGNFHHGSINCWPTSAPIEVKDIVGKKVGVRAYSQTTGLWVRGILKEEYGINSGDVTWVTTEGPHVSEYVEPPYVERTSSSLAELLKNGEIVAAVVGASSLVEKEGVELRNLLPDAKAAQAAWYERHQTIPVNHMVTIQTALLEGDPIVAKNIYRAFVRAIEEAKPKRGETPKDRAIIAGISDELLRSVDVAIKYGLEQEMLREEITAEEIFADAKKYVVD